MVRPLTATAAPAAISAESRLVGAVEQLGRLPVLSATVRRVQAIAERTGAAVDTAHLGGLLHDVGKLVMPLAFGDATLDAIAAEHPAGTPRARRERERLGVDHAAAGALVAHASQV